MRPNGAARPRYRVGVVVSVIALFLSVAPASLAGDGNARQSPFQTSGERVANIAQELRALRRTIERNIAYAFRFDSSRGKVVVETNGPANAFASVSSKYGASVQVVTGATIRLTGRQNDSSPFWGGAKILGPGGCTSGFVAKKGTTTYMSTAGHCFGLGASVTSGSGAAEGTVKLRDYPTYEMEFYSGKTYSPRMYSGVKGDDSTNIPITGRVILRIRIGDVLCRTGYSSGRACDWKVKDTSADFCPNWPTCTGNLYAFDGTLPVVGDSGGPIYRSANGGALIAGSIVGYSSTIFGNTSYGEKIGQVLERWGLTQVCSAACIVQ